MIPIHKALILRLILVWILLSTVIGGVILLLELNAIDNALLELAAEETTEIRKLHGQFLSAPSQDHLDQIRSELASHIHAGHFIVINLYNAEKNLVLSVKDDAEEHLISDTEVSKPDLLFGSDTQFRRFLGKSGQVFILVLVSLDADATSIAEIGRASCRERV